MDMIEKLHAVSEELQSKKRYAKSEASTRSFLIDPFLRALGYDPSDPNDVEPEFTADFVAKGKKVDYALKKGGRPIIFVEFKSATKNLSFEHTIQLQHYFSTKLDVRFGIVTNGLEYRLFADIDNPNVMDDEPFLTVDMLNLDDRLLTELATFSKSGFEFYQALSKARQLKFGSVIRQRIETEMNQPSRDIIKYFATGFYLGSFNNSVQQEFSPIIKHAWDELVDQEISRRLQGHEQEEESPTSVKTNLPLEKPAAEAPTDDSNVEIPIRGYLKKGKYEGHRFEAKMLVYDGIHYHQEVVLFLEQLMTPSGAAKRGFLNAVGEHPDVNGWWFWKLTDPDSGEERPIDHVVQDEDLRRRILKNA